MGQRAALASAIISAMTIGITGPRRRAPWRGAVARRRGGAHHRCHRPLDLPDPARAHGRFPGRLAVVYHDRLFGRLLDDHLRRSRSLLRRLVATAIILWVNGSIASRFGRSPWAYRPADFEWKRTGVVTLPDVL